MLRASGVGFAYPGGTEVVSGVDLDVSAGDLLAILGPNGSGKTTLLRLLAGILPPSRGSILLAGRPLGSFSRHELARRMSYVPQNGNVALSFTVAEVVALGRHPYQGGFRFEDARDLAAVEEALALTETAHLAHRVFHSLSGGERQRVLLARAIAQDAEVLILDEPTAALDLKHEVRVWEILTRLAARGRAVIGVTHHINLAALYSPRLLILKEGRAVASGTPAELLRKELLEWVYETPVRVESTSSTPYVLPERPGG